MIFGLFQRYADTFEKEVHAFFKGISHFPPGQVQKRAVLLMQKDLVVLNLWLEHVYKGYRYLNVKKRKELYANREKWVEKFRLFCVQNSFSEEFILHRLKSFKVSALDIQNRHEKWEYVLQILTFFESDDVFFKYRSGADFGGLFSDNRTQKLIGDCNQMVTLYLYLYSLKFPITDFQN
ncbi:hypothetical protein HC823_01195 [Candidatus Gracilibacteria bacterium]|nr:hypothetical protein [Candidatus Gracilibacteria bacterium]